MEGAHVSDFRGALEARDIETAIDLLAEDVVFRSPVAFPEYRGRSTVAPVLRAVTAVFEDFRYTAEYVTPDGTAEALQFETRIGARVIEGCDFITRNESGLVQELVVMVRPLSALVTLAEAMRALAEPVG
jgi:ketosteroid isomerase-like protein